ncbi:hypothetical protein [Synoicihabitans lomoniglobus]|uniref:Zinc-finger domain-containing protein n=1 Tax=Synoicihabitans lomoniglobus TaxID=2909285 RepID=A0AAF0CNC4_9BACT|nr:hypothetical protein [Opitutaceae bacterium LMO-M01]WED65328.1 hypothetical protein PXH66_00510 [Opitutaceae bacterium LMO-M01]
MNCRTAQDQLLAARDAPAGIAGDPALLAHVAACAECRAVQTSYAAAVDTWRATTARVTVPDAQTEWHAVRRRLRQTQSAPSGTISWSRFLRFAVPFTAVAAVALVVWQGQPLPNSNVPLSTAPVVAANHAPPHEPWAELESHFAFTAHAEYVETDNDEASPFVYVDDESGWLIVWASDPPADAASI